MTRLRNRALHVALVACLAIAFALASLPARASCQRLCPVKNVRVCQKVLGVTVKCWREERVKCFMQC
jgi:hypothetical protein